MPLKVVIVGTGIAGLGTAIALKEKGHVVTVVESTSQLQPIGGVITIQANASRILDSWGVYEALVTICAATLFAPCARRYKDGEFLIKRPPELYKNEYGYPLLHVHRADLQQVLYKAAVERGVTLRLGCPVITIDDEHEDNVAVVIRSGERIAADVIVGADGIKSTVRKSVVPDLTICIRDSGMDATRVNIPGDIVRSNPETSIFMDQIGLWIGPSITLAIVPVRRGDKWLLGLDCCHARDENSAGRVGESWKQNIKLFKERFKDFAPAIQKVLSYVKEVEVWKIIETIPPSWVSKSGRIILIGDAAHAILPYVGQGGGMAIEDAATLAECLERVKTADGISNVLKVFQEIRGPRCKLVQEWSIIKGKRATLPDSPEQENRDQKLKSINAWVKAKHWDKVHIDELPELESPSWKAWLIGHDAVGFANRELDKRFGSHN